MTSPPEPTCVVQFSPSTNPGAAPVWVTISSVEQLTVKRGYAYEQRRAQTGSAQATIDNSSGNFTAGNPASIYAPGITTDKPVQVLVTPPAPYNGTTYVLHSGSADRWPTSLDAAGAEYAQTVLSTLDGFDWLNSVTLKSPIMQEILADGPVAYFPMADDPGTPAASSALPGVGAAPLMLFGDRGSDNSSGSFAFGGTALAACDAGTSLALSPDLTETPAPGSVYTADGSGYIVRVEQASPPPPLPGDTVSFECVVAVQSGYFYQGVPLFSMYDGQGFVSFVVEVLPASVKVISQAQTNGGPSVSASLPSTLGSDLAPHHLVASKQTVNGQTVVTITVDGVSASASIASGSLRTVVPTHAQLGGDAARLSQIGQLNNSDDTIAFLPVLIEHVALYATVLPTARILTHAQSVPGFVTDTAGVRIGRILGYSGVPTAMQSLEPGRSVLGPMVTAGTPALQACQDAADVDQGVFFCNMAGLFTFQDRGHTLNAPSRVTLNTSDGLLPVEADLTFELDKQYVENDISGTRQNSITQRVVDPVSVAAHRTRNPSGGTYTFNFTNDDDVLAAIQWRLLRFSEPGVRAPQMTLRPVTSPALWPWVMTLEVGDRVTIVNLPPTAPSSTMDFTIVNVAVKQATPSDWAFTYLLSPADLRDYWVIDDPSGVNGGVDQHYIAF